MPRVIIAMRDEELAAQLLDDGARARLAAVAEIVPGVMDDASDPRWDDDLAECEILLTGWGGPSLDERLLARAPRLTAVAHAAGTVKRIVTEASWTRGIRVSSAADVNGIPVAEYALSMILLAGKRVFESQDFMRRERSLGWAADGSLGNHRATIGIIGASRIGRRVLELLRPFDHEVLLADPTLDDDDAAILGASLVPLRELLARSSVVSLHAPLLDSTIGMIGARE
jgi:phosphoglycerate dehydrogenase-like enzyme